MISQSRRDFPLDKGTTAGFQDLLHSCDGLLGTGSFQWADFEPACLLADQVSLDTVTVVYMQPTSEALTERVEGWNRYGDEIGQLADSEEL